MRLTFGLVGIGWLVDIPSFLRQVLSSSIIAYTYYPNTLPFTYAGLLKTFVLSFGGFSFCTEYFC